mgnify:CR=1 FL=1
MELLGDEVLARIFRHLADDLTLFQYVLPRVCTKWLISRTQKIST